MTLFGHARLLLFGADDIHTMLPNKVYKSSAQSFQLNCSSSCGWGGTDDFVLRSTADSESLRLISSIKILNWNSVFFSFFAMCTQCGGIKLAKSSPSSSHIQLTRTDVLKSMTSHSRLPAEPGERRTKWNDDERLFLCTHKTHWAIEILCRRGTIIHHFKRV